MTDQSLASRVARRARSDLDRLRLRMGIMLAGGSAFEYWGRLGDQLLETRGVKQPPSEEFVARASQQLAYLKAQGLAPNHTFLDYGCSILRTAAQVIPYLEPGRYVGTEVSAGIQRRGIELLESRGIARTRYHLLIAHSPRLLELKGFTFDFVFANSVLQYVSNQDLAEVLAAFRRHLAPAGKVFISFPSPDQREKLQSKGNFFRTREEMAQICLAAGFSVEHGEPSPDGFPSAPNVLLKLADAPRPAARA